MTRPVKPIIDVTPESAGWTYVGFQVYRLIEGDVVRLEPAAEERTVIVLEGTCRVTAGDVPFEHVGGRTSVFEDTNPEAVYVPPMTAVEVRAEGVTEVAIASAVATEGDGPARRIGRDAIPRERRGSGSTERRIRHILDQHHAASKLLLVEVITPAGNWSSYPPHKHDEEIAGQEAYLEETYYYRISPDNGCALQRVYDKSDVNHVYTPRDGEVVLVPRGYHPVAAPPGFDVYYLNVMAGHNREWKYTLDADYAHIAPKDGNIMGKVEPSS